MSESNPKVEHYERLASNSMPPGGMAKHGGGHTGKWTDVGVCPSCKLRGWKYEMSYARPCPRCGAKWYGFRVGRWMKEKVLIGKKVIPARRRWILSDIPEHEVDEYKTFQFWQLRGEE
jgi:hypothetical protein